MRGVVKLSEMPTPVTTISVDLKKYRIRVYKAALHQIGDPVHIQLLVNPEDMIVAIRAVEHESPGGQTHRVSRSIMQSDNSVEIYSRSFIDKLCSIIGGLDPGCTYRIYGTAIPGQKLLVFSLKTIKKTCR